MEIGFKLQKSDRNTNKDSCEMSLTEPKGFSFLSEIVFMYKSNTCKTQTSNYFILLLLLLHLKKQLGKHICIVTKLIESKSVSQTLQLIKKVHRFETTEREDTIMTEELIEQNSSLCLVRSMPKIYHMIYRSQLALHKHSWPQTHLDEWSGVCPFRNTWDNAPSRCYATGGARLSNCIPLIVILMRALEKR